MSASLDDLQPDLAPFARELVRAAGAARLLPRVTSTRRSNAEQQRLYRRFLAGQQPYPVARPGTSAHEYGWAFDMVVSPMSALPDVGAYWQELGGVWGGNPTRAGSGYDPVHFEYPGWRDYVDFTQPDLRSSQDRPLPFQVAKYFDPSFGVGTELFYQTTQGPARLARVLTGQSTIQQEYEDFLSGLESAF